MQGSRTNSLAFRLTGTLIIAFAALLAVTALVLISLQGRLARDTARINGLALGEGLFAALHRHMLSNDRDGLHAAVRRIAERSPGLGIRIINKQGRVVFSSDDGEVGSLREKTAAGCRACHSAGRPQPRLAPAQRSWISSLASGSALGVITPIENEPACSRADCHAHHPGQKMLGVLETTLGLAAVDQARHHMVWLLLAIFTTVTLLLVAVVLVVVKRSVQQPIRALSRTLRSLGRGDYSARSEETPVTEFARLGEAVNRMALDLARANASLVEWAQMLERRCDEKSNELMSAQEQLVQLGQLASLGKLAILVATEVEGPLATMRSSSERLLQRLAEPPGSTPPAEQLAEEQRLLQGISSDSTRCGEIVSSLLMFTREAPPAAPASQVNTVVQKVLTLLQHKIDAAGTRLSVHLALAVPDVACGPLELEQTLLALCVNSIEAMPGGGNLTVETGTASSGQVLVRVADTGIGIPAELRGRIFEPFFTTKSNGNGGNGLGLGLTVVQSILQRISGRIEVTSEVGNGATITLYLPAEERVAPAPPAAPPSC